MEPDPPLRDEVSRTLTAAGYQVDSFDNPSDAAVRAAGQRYDLLITEYRMPEMKGTTLISQVFAIQLIPLIITSSDPQEVMDETLGRLAMEPRLIRKPFEMWELVDLVGKTIRRRHVE